MGGGDTLLRGATDVPQGLVQLLSFHGHSAVLGQHGHDSAAGGWSGTECKERPSTKIHPRPGFMWGPALQGHRPTLALDVLWWGQQRPELLAGAHCSERHFSPLQWLSLYPPALQGAPVSNAFCAAEPKGLDSLPWGPGRQCDMKKRGWFLQDTHNVR